MQGWVLERRVQLVRHRQAADGVLGLPMYIGLKDIGVEHANVAKTLARPGQEA